MKVLKNKKIHELEDEFTSIYPGLKIRFYKKSHKSFKASPAEMEWDRNLTFHDINPSLVEGEINLDPETTVLNLELQFEESYQIHAQVFRRSGDLWLQTVRTDDWTLGLQNERGLSSIKN